MKTSMPAFHWQTESWEQRQSLPSFCVTWTIRSRGHGLATPGCLWWIIHVNGTPGNRVLKCGHCAGARGLATSCDRVSHGIKGYLLIRSQRVSWPALGFHLAPWGYLTDTESGSSMTVWSVPRFRISGFECRWNPLRKSTGMPQVHR